eukprot:6182275-Pleurochrysis_carterae.AAC.1
MTCGFSSFCSNGSPSSNAKLESGESVPARPCAQAPMERKQRYGGIFTIKGKLARWNAPSCAATRGYALERALCSVRDSSESERELSRGNASTVLI